MSEEKKLDSRNEIYALFETGLEIRFGGKDGKVFTSPILKMKQSALWRKKVEEDLGELLPMMGVSIQQPTEVLKSLKVLLIQAPDFVSAWVFDWMEKGETPDFDKEWIEENGYDVELVDAFIDICGVAFPFTRAIQTATERLRSARTGMTTATR